MQKIRYRLVYNRKNKLNKQGEALIQIEAKLNQRNIYLTSNIYMKPECWDINTSQVVNHPHAIELNTLLFEKIIQLQSIELNFWKRGIQPTLALLRESVRRKMPVSVTFSSFARSAISQSDKRQSTKENLLTTIRQLEIFRPGIDFADLTYSFIKEFESWLRERGKSVNTVAKHLRQLRTLCNEAINDGYMPADLYPFRKFKIRQEKSERPFLTPDELQKLEKIQIFDNRKIHILDAFLFCCYTGLRYSDFRALSSDKIVYINRAKWLVMKMQKTTVEIKLPLFLLFGGKALHIIEKYASIEELAYIPCNSDTNRQLSEIAEYARIKKHITFHTSRHTCATLLIHQGVAITTVQKLLGHTSVKTTQVYSEVLSDTVVRDLNRAKKRQKKSIF